MSIRLSAGAALIALSLQSVVAQAQAPQPVQGDAVLGQPVPAENPVTPPVPSEQAPVPEAGEPLAPPLANDPQQAAPLAAPAATEPPADKAGAAWDYLDQEDGTVAPADPADLDALGLAGAEAAQSYPNVDVYGFVDFTYWQPVMKSDNRWDFVVPNTSSFQVGNINLYVASQMSRTLRSLIEVRFTYLPNGKNRGTQENPGEPYFNSATSDYTDSERQIKLGSLEIERVQLEYAPYEWLTFVMGQWLTPYGIWNVDHGTPTTILAHRPYLVGEELIPERQTGLMAQGAFRSGANRFGYHLALSNGRGPLDSYYDMDENKAVTGRLFWQNYSKAGDLTLGAATYVGRYTDAQRSLGLKAEDDGSVVINATDTVTVQYDERSFSADAQLTRGGLRLFSEFAMNVREYTDSGRPLVGGLLTIIDGSQQNSLIADQRRWGAYLTGGYRFEWFGVMPFAQVEYFRLDVPITPEVVAGYVGVNVRPHEAVTFKLHYGQAHFPNADERGPGKDDLQVVESQVAWAF